MLDLKHAKEIALSHYNEPYAGNTPSVYSIFEDESNYAFVFNTANNEEPDDVPLLCVSKTSGAVSLFWPVSDFPRFSKMRIIQTAE